MISHRWSDATWRQFRIPLVSPNSDYEQLPQCRKRSGFQECSGVSVSPQARCDTLDQLLIGEWLVKHRQARTLKKRAAPLPHGITS